jgi:hypothetical protein
MSLMGRVHSVTTVCFQAPHFQRQVFGGEPGAQSGTYRPKPEVHGVERVAAKLPFTLTGPVALFTQPAV